MLPYTFDVLGWLWRKRRWASCQDRDACWRLGLLTNQCTCQAFWGWLVVPSTTKLFLNVPWNVCTLKVSRLYYVSVSEPYYSRYQALLNARRCHPSATSFAFVTMNASALDEVQPSQNSEPSIKSLQPIHSPKEGKASLHGDQLKRDSHDSIGAIALNLFQGHGESSLPSSSFSEGSLNRNYREGKGWLRLKEGGWREGIPHGAHKPGDTSFKFTKAPDFKMPAYHYYWKIHPRRFLKQIPDDVRFF